MQKIVKAYCDLRLILHVDIVSSRQEYRGDDPVGPI